MVGSQRVFKFVIVGGVLPLLLAGCANSPLGSTLERSLAADPRLTDETVEPVGEPTSSPTVAAVELPSNFPPEIPRYPNAELVAVSPTGESTSSAVEEQTRWTTSDASDEVAQFYQARFTQNGWRLVEPATVAEETEPSPAAIVAEREGLRVVINLPTPATTADTTFTLSYLQDDSIAVAPTATPEAGTAIEDSPSVDAPPPPTQSFTDLAQAPEELQSYITDLAQLGVLTLPNSESATLFKPNQAITRREYARWLVATNNRIYRDRPANKVRLGVSSSQPAFQDVPRSAADFAAIQGLAEAGLIPSPLSGDANTVTFRPDAPLTREELLLWKLPIDTRQPLPTATVQAVQQTWGFQDVARINPIALRAVLADFQNGDLSNIRRAFGFTTIFQPKKAVTRAEAAATLWFVGVQGEGISAQDVLRDVRDGASGEN